MNRIRSASGATVAALLLSAGALLAQQPRGTEKHEPGTGAQKREPAESQKRESDEEAEEHAVPEAQVPAAVRQAFHRAYPNARVTKWTTEHENGRTIYEAESRDGATNRDVNLAADGTILETETEVTMAQLPAAVRAAAQAGNPHIEKAERVVMGRDTTYEFHVQGRREELKLLPNGRPVH